MVYCGMTYLPRRVLRLLIPLFALAPLCGCVAAEALVAVEASSDMGFGRGIADIGVSAVTGRDCSAVRLDKGLPYCAPRGKLPGEPPFCTQTIGTVTCWKDPESFASPPRQLADTPALTPEQAKLITARWPAFLNQ